MKTGAKDPSPRYRTNEPLISPKVMEYLGQVIAERYLSPGNWVRKFEKAWAKECGVLHAVAASSGTAALHLALLSTGVGKGDEVIVPLPDQRKEYEVIRVLTVHDDLGKNKE